MRHARGCGYNGATIRGTPGSWHREDIVHYTHNFAVCATDRWLFIAGLGGTVLIHDGHRWRTDTLPIHTHIRGLAATSPERVVAVGLGGAILRFDGSTWRPEKSPTQQHLEAVWLGESGQGWASGYGGTLLAYDGKEWTQAPSHTTANLYAVHGTETHALAVGAGGTVCRWTVP